MTEGGDSEMKDPVRCIAAAGGGAIGGAIAGAAVGSVVPIIGTIGCGIAGAIGGGFLSWGSASSCDK
jgi:hypothetical protein